jgi:seryl-tRNA synthetase
MTASFPPDVEGFRAALVEHGILIPSGVMGLHGWNVDFERVLEGVNRYASARTKEDGSIVRWYPPVIGRDHLVQAGYLKSMPQLLGTVRAFNGTEREQADLLVTAGRGDDWDAHFASAGAVLSPAACYPLYPTLTGTLPAEGVSVDMTSYAHRHEPSLDPVRMRFFRVREFVRMGTPEHVAAFREKWQQRAPELLRGLGLDVVTDIANDPFFGRGGRMLAATQREQALKHEFLVHVSSTTNRSAVSSVNYHEDHFGTAFNILLPDGRHAFSACVGLGLERIVLGLFRAHGPVLADWPADVRERLHA